MRTGLGLLIAVAVAWLMLVIIYYGFGWSPKITVGHGDIEVQRRRLFWRYSTAALTSTWSGFWLMTFLHHLGWLVIIGACVAFSSAYVVGYLWMVSRLAGAYVDDTATQDMLRFAASVREIDGAGERERGCK